MCPFIWLATSSPHYTTFPAHAFGGLVHPIRLIISKSSPVTPFSLHALWGPLLAFIGPGEALRHVEAGLDISDPICLSCLLEWVIAFRLDKDLCPVQPPSSTLLHTIWVVSLVGSADLVPIPMGSIRVVKHWAVKAHARNSCSHQTHGSLLPPETVPEAPL